MPKTVNELYSQEVHKNIHVTFFSNAFVLLNMKLKPKIPNDPVKKTVEMYKQGFKQLQNTQDQRLNESAGHDEIPAPELFEAVLKENIGDGLKNLDGLVDFLLKPQVDGKKGYELLKESLINEDDKANFENHLREMLNFLGFKVDPALLPKTVTVKAKKEPDPLPDRPMRLNQLLDYFVHHLTTTRQRTDFVVGLLATQSVNPKPPLLYKAEYDLLLQLFTANFEVWNTKENRYELQRSQENLDELNQICMEQIYNLGKAYINKLDNDYPSDKYPNREKAKIAAATEIQESSKEIAMYDYIFRNNYASVSSDPGNSTEYYYDEKSKKSVKFNTADYLEERRDFMLIDNGHNNPSSAEMQVFNFGNNMKNPQESPLTEELRHKTDYKDEDEKNRSYKEYGLDRNKLLEKRFAIQKDIADLCDLNWTKDETFWDTPHFIDRSNVSDYNRYFIKSFRALDNSDDKIRFLSDAALYSGRRFSGLTQSERKAFDSCTKEFFNAVGPDGKFNYDEFENALESYIDLAVNQDIQTVQEANSEKARLMVGSNDPDMLREAAEYTSDAALERGMLKNHIVKAAENGLISREGMLLYLEKNHIKVDKDTKDQSISYKFMDLLNKKIAEKEAGIDKNLESFINVPETGLPKKNPLSPDLQKKLLEDQNRRYVKKTDSAEPAWRKGPEINQAFLDRISNLYDQAKKEDHWYHWNFFYYREIRTLLERIDGINSSIKANGGVIREKDRANVEGMLNLLGQYSTDYLNEKRKDRRTSLGKERYEIVLSVLNMIDHGEAKNILKSKERSLSAASKKGKKSISMDELQKRTTRNYSEQKKYKRYISTIEEVNKEIRNSLGPLNLK